jgi:hypothetical protein
MTTPAQANLKATNLERKLNRKFPDLLIIVYPLDGDLVIKASSDECCALEYREWLNDGLIADDLYRITSAGIGNAVQRMEAAAARDAEWLAQAAKTVHQ